MPTEEFPGEADARRRSLAATVPRDVPDEELAGVRDVSFPIVMRGYDRAAVDAYVTRVNRIIAELQVSRSPQSAIRHALDQVSEETRGILERAHETAEDIAARSRSQAADRVERAEAEARALLNDADARVRELEADADVVDGERTRLIEDVRLVAEELQRVANDAAVRFPPEPAEGEAEGEAEAEAEADTVAIDPDEVESEMPDEEAEAVDAAAAAPAPADGDEPESKSPPVPPPVPGDREA